MAVRRKKSTASRAASATTFSTSGYGGGRKGLTTANGKTSQGGRFITRNQQYRNVRTGLGLSGG